MKKTFASIVVLFLTITCLAQSSWTPWQSFSNNGLAISYGRVNATTVTWKFKNTAGCTIQPFNLQYSYVDANTGQYMTQNDVMPEALRPGQEFGGWSAFTANTRGSIQVQSAGADIVCQ
jgi:hypothetical protein